MSSNTKIIQDLIFFYVKENYKKYLTENSIEFIPEQDIMKTIDSIYTERKKHLQQFLKDSLKEIQKDDYMGDLIVNNICYDIFNDDQVCKHRLYTEIKLFQDTKNKQ
tara:strand:- start:287 stop:607 length:321 start_codon:yes stop_codon:yes gene_type:complete